MELSLFSFLDDHVKRDALNLFCAQRATPSLLLSALTSVVEEIVTAQLSRTFASPDSTLSVLQVRDLADAVWRDLVRAEPSALGGTTLDTRLLVARLRTDTSRTDVEGRIRTLVTSILDNVRAKAVVHEVRDVSPRVVTRLAADLLCAWEQSARGGEVRVSSALPHEPVARVTSMGVGTGAGEEVMRDVAARLAARLAAGERLGVADIKALVRELQMSSVTGALSFAYHALMDDWADVFLAAPAPRLLGVPAMLREARPWMGEGDNPAAAAPKADGGALPPPTQFVYTVGCGTDGHVGLGGRELLPGGGLLVVLPDWHGTRADGAQYAHYWRVDPTTHIASVLYVFDTLTERGARVKLAFELDVPEGEERIDWIDAQRDFEGHLVLAWGGFNPHTGGVAWTYYKGLDEADEYARGADPFLNLDDADVDDMFAARLESGQTTDFRDHGSLLLAEVRYASCASTPSCTPTTTVVYHDTVLNVLPGVDAVAVWGSPYEYVVWTREGRAASIRGATSADAVTNFRASAAFRLLVPPLDHARRVKSIAPWWWPIHDTM